MYGGYMWWNSVKTILGQYYGSIITAHFSKPYTIVRGPKIAG